MTTLHDAARQALEALELHAEQYPHMQKGYTVDAITALRAALAQQAEPVEPVQQPYCYVYEYDGAFGLHREFYPKVYNGHKPDRTVPVYTAPPQRKPLTEEEIDAVWDQWFGAYGLRGPGGPYTRRGFARAIERAHGITDPQIEDRLARHGIPMPGDPK